MENNHETIQTAEEMVVELPFDDVEEMVCIPVSEYQDLVIKAHALDTLADDIRWNIDHDKANYEIVDDTLVRIVTGTRHYVKPAAAPEEPHE